MSEGPVLIANQAFECEVWRNPPIFLSDFVASGAGSLRNQLLTAGYRREFPQPKASRESASFHGCVPYIAPWSFPRN